MRKPCRYLTIKVERGLDLTNSRVLTKRYIVTPEIRKSAEGIARKRSRVRSASCKNVRGSIPAQAIREEKVID